MHSCTHGCRHKSRELENDSLTIICIKVKIPLKCIHVSTYVHDVKRSEKKNNTMISSEGNFCVKFLESSRDSP